MYQLNNMKRIHRLIASAAMLLTAMTANAQSVKVNLDVEGLGDTLLYFSRTESIKEPYEAAGKNGKFALDIPAKGVGYFNIYDKASRKSGNRIYFEYMGVPGETVTLKGTVDDYTISGTGFYKEYGKAMGLVRDIKKQRAALSREFFQLPKAQQDDDAYLKPFMQKNQILRAQQDSIFKDYVRQHPSSEVSVALVAALPISEFEEAAKVLSPEVKAGRMKPLIDMREEMLAERKAVEERGKAVAPGKVAPVFTLPDPDGKMVSLTDFRGKYLVLDFWGTWCGWCVKGIPEMKKSYAKYSDKVEFLSIDCRESAEKWKAGLQKYQMPWRHVRWEGKPDVPYMYALQGYPTKFLINPDGTVNKVFIGESEEFYNYLDSLFGKQ